MKEKISEILYESFNPSYLKIIDESHLHHAHFSSDLKEGTHLKVSINSESPLLKNKSKVHQHKAIYSVLAQYMNNPIHALSLKINS